jgi:hypothetical protein
MIITVEPSVNFPTLILFPSEEITFDGNKMASFFKLVENNNPKLIKIGNVFFI